jgi:glycosyltransferase involved in cell wall biosynthesis
LIRAVRLLVNRGFNVHLHIAGASDSSVSTGEDYRATLERLIEEQGLPGQARLLGPVSEEVVRGELAACHIFALASLAEPLGVAIMEAMAMETAVVATATGGVPELIDDGVEGILVPPRDPGRLTDALERILRDPELATRLGHAGPLRVMSEFHSGVSAQTMARLVESNEVLSTATSAQATNA